MTTSDEGLREIQINGKQLVFLFMAVTVVSVVIFLCGVLVGRGVQRPLAAPVETSAAPEADVTASAAPPPSQPLEPTKAEGLEYSGRLEGAGPVPEKLLTPAEAAARATAAPSVATPPPAVPHDGPAVPSAARTAVPVAGATPDAPAPVVTAPAEKPLPPEPKGDGMAIQVAALGGRGEAEALVARLKSKGYSAYIVPALAGQPAGFRVRVGKFKTRGEAEKVAAKLEQEEQFKPWITR